MAGSISATTASLIAAAVAAGGVGVGAYEANNASIDQNAAQQQQKQALLQSQQAQANQANLTKQEAVLSQEGQAQQQTGGSLTDPGTSSLTDLLAGYPGFSGGVGSPTATPAISPTSLTPGGSGAPDIGAILAALRNNGAGGSGTPGSSSSSISGGNWPTQPASPQQSFQLANPVIS